ncbi:MAG: hypothetical protein R3F44_19785 [Candidatus Competibacteraceae bacterium]
MTASLALALAGYVTEAGALEPSAVLRQMQGRVFVGQTTTMELARDDLPLYAGNRVVAVAGGQAEVVYSDGCAVAVPENSLLVVEGPRQCRQGRVSVRTIDGFQDTRIGQAGPLPAAAGGDKWVARLDRPKGGVSVILQENGKWEPGLQDMDVQSVTRLTTTKNGEVTVVFDGCDVYVGPNEDVKIEDLKDRCKGGALAGTGTTGVGGAGAGAGAGAAAGISSTTTAAVAAAVAGGAAVLIHHANQDDPDASP